MLKQGTKQNLNERVHELKQLADSIKNPKVQNKSEILKEQKKREFINKLSELLNKQEIIMETLSCFKRAGADAILTYFALDAAEIIKNG